jgi:hypothetical protein
MSAVSERRRYAAMIVLFLVGFGMIALARAIDAYWPLFLTPLPYAVIPWMIARTQAGGSSVSSQAEGIQSSASS